GLCRTPALHPDFQIVSESRPTSSLSSDGCVLATEDSPFAGRFLARKCALSKPTHLRFPPAIEPGPRLRLRHGRTRLPPSPVDQAFPPRDGSARPDAVRSRPFEIPRSPGEFRPRSAKNRSSGARSTHGNPTASALATPPRSLIRALPFSATAPA